MPPQEKPAPTTRDGPLLGAAREKPSRVHGDLGQPQISEYGKKREHFMFEFMGRKAHVHAPTRDKD